jgi:hypothetical protein
MHLLRHTFDGMRRIVRANSALSRSYLWTYLGDTFFETQAVAIRRQAEMKDDRVLSLGRLIHEIEATPIGSHATSSWRVGVRR